MSSLYNEAIIGAAGQSSGYEIEQSLRFNDDDTAHFDRTPSSVGARATWTYSVWVKGSDFSGDANTLLSGGNYSYGTYLWFRDGGHIALGRYYSGSYTFLVEADGFYRDPTAWYHIVCVFDSSQSTASDRVKLYVNGEQITSFTTASYPSSNFETDINNDGIQWIGERGSNSDLKLHGYLAEAHLVDGTALDPTSFGEYDSNGVWRPIEVSLTGPNDGTTWSDYLTDSNGAFDSSYPATKAFNGTTDAANTARATTTNTTSTFEPPTDISYSSSVEVWTYYSGSVSLNGGSAVSVSNDQAWRTIATGSGSLDTLTFTASSSTVYLGAIRIDGVVLIDGNTHQYGKNGFYLTFDPSATNGIGHDHSGNGNNWTPNNFTTSGTGTDVMSDTPTKNFPTLNPLDNLNGRYSNDPTNGNLEVSIPSDSVSKRNFPGFYSTQAIPTTGKFYFEFEPSQEYTTINIVDVDEVDTISSGDHVGQSDKLSFQYFCESGNYRFNGSTTASGLGGFTSGNIYGVRVDLENETFRVYENGIAGSELSISGYLGADARIAPSVDASGSSGTVTMNFGQREFAYPPGTASATDYFNCVTYTGNGGNLSVTGVGFQPDFVWIKNRGRTSSPHVLVDVVRGATKALTTGTGGDTTMNGTDDFKSFDSDGFSLGTSSNFFVNSTNDTHVAWCWKAGGAASDNTDGDITSSVSVNQDAGFSVVSYTSQSTKPLNVGHGLGKKPDFILTKNRDATASWGGYHSGTGATKSIFINTTGSGTVSADYFADTEPTTSVFTVNDSNNTHSYGTTNEFIAYCWTAKDGVSKFGTYTGNGSSTGPFIECGFKPRLVIVKRTDAASNWFMYDTIRGTNNKLYAENTGTENSEDAGSTSSNTILSLSTGFQMTSGNGSNTNGGTYIFMAWAENFSADENFKSLNTANLPAPEIKDGSDYFNTVLWSGNGATDRDITGVGFAPDLVWAKDRSGALSHVLQDRVRGAGNTILQSNGTGSETSQGLTNGYIDNFTSDGFETTSSTANQNYYFNSGSDTYVAWNWLAGGTGSSNTDGTITSTVSVNTTAGFSIVSYTGTGAGASVGHGLGVAPSLLLFKNRDSAENWAVWHSALDATTGEHLGLNQQNAVTTNSVIFNSTAPTSTVFSVGNNGRTGSSGDDYIAYCFAEVEGYSKIGTYTGNGSSNGPFIYTGFKPAWLMVKKNANSTDWKIYDAGREPYNVVANRIAANTSNAELDGNAQEIDFVSNGFKFRGTNGDQNSSGTFYYVAFASSPFGGSGVSPATAR